ncbi:sulfurtransferase TusA family protein [Aeromonas schubertii]|uniref:sulfurtransferase TusA family protein n=1 Tax=Aeromonas schubertii TaxID=652 RepID=UPI0010A8E834|nr:sulfurtransferase TusA family protein [Aeromonas schubertii]QCG47425.1 sulfurtransferase TusA family protein [Aeromonas schubertii]
MERVDLRALRCPEPLIRVKLWLREAATGETCELLLSDPGSRRDIPRYLTRMGHHWETCEESADHLHLRVQVCHKELL